LLLPNRKFRFHSIDYQSTHRKRLGPMCRSDNDSKGKITDAQYAVTVSCRESDT
jgi:hypothetical protein